MDIKGIEIFRIGTWKGSRTVEATSAMLDAIVSNFSTINSIPGYGVPLKLGHNNRVGEPAFGWLKNVYRQGDVIVADAGDVPAEIVDAIGKRRYNSVSIEIYPSLMYDGKTFENVLGGVALLGAEWPAVKGLAPLSSANFAEAGEKLELQQETPVTLKFTQEDANALVLAAETRVRTELQALLNDATGKATAAETRATTAEAALKVFKADELKTQFATVIDTAIAAGKLLPKQKDSMLAFAANFPATTKVGDKEVSSIAAFKEFVDGLPSKVRFGEQGKATQTPVGSGDGEKASEVVHARVQATQAEHPKLSYEDAMKAVFAADPALKTRYATEM